jgi:hypothetical protein
LRQRGRRGARSDEKVRGHGRRITLNPRRSREVTRQGKARLKADFIERRVRLALAAPISFKEQRHRR